MLMFHPYVTRYSPLFFSHSVSLSLLPSKTVSWLHNFQIAINACNDQKTRVTKKKGVLRRRTRDEKRELHTSS